MLEKTNFYIVIRSLIIAYIITGALLLFAAFLLYKMEPEKSLVSVGILVIYVFSSFFGGFLGGKKIGVKKFAWGLIIGAVYFLFLLLASWIFGGGIQAKAGEVITTMLLCLGGGMLGGMFS